jgi:hypothetical protein
MQNLYRTRNRHFIAVATALLVLTSCQKEDLASVPEKPAQSAHISDLQNFLANSTGYPKEKIVFSAEKNEFVLDGDGIISLQEAEEHQKRESEGVEFLTKVESASEASQRRYTYVVAPAKTYVKIYVDVAVPASWSAQLDKAIINWNSVNSKLVLERTSVATSAHVLVKAYYSASSTIATGQYPSALGSPGRYVNINTYHNGLSDSKKLFTLTHELGHVFGFTHTDGTYGTLVSGTTDNDPSSIMRSSVLDWNGFTANDQLAIHAVYPK